MRPYLPAVALTWLSVLLLAGSSPYFFSQNDNQIQFEPAFAEIGRQLRQGRFPLLSESCWCGGAFAGEYQFGLFSVVQLPVLWLRSLLGGGELGATFYSAFYLTVAATGGVSLARSLRLDRLGSGLVALGFAANGFVGRWGARGWSPQLASSAWLPWLWAELASPQPRGSRVALWVYLIASSGWPYTLAWLALLVLAYLAQALRARQYSQAARLSLGAGLGLALAAPAWMLLLEHSSVATREVDRWQERLQPSHLLGLFLPFQDLGTRPEIFGNPSANLSCGFLPAVVLAALLSRPGSCAKVFRLQPLVVTIAGLSLLLALGPSFGPFRWPFRWLGLLLPALSLLAALSLQLDPALARRWWPGALGLGLAALLSRSYAPPTLLQLGLHGGVLLTLALARRAGATAMLFLTWVCCLSSLAWESPPGWDRWPRPAGLDQLAPLQANRRYLALYTADDLYAPSSEQAWAAFRPANLPMLSGAQFLNGCSSICAEPVYWLTGLGVSGSLDDPAWAYAMILPRLGPRGALARCGIHGLIVSERSLPQLPPALPALGWKRVTALPGVSLWHREATTPVAASEIAARQTNSLYGTAQAHPGSPAEDLQCWLSPYAGASEPLQAVQERRFRPVELSVVRDDPLEVQVSLRGRGELPALVRFNRPFYPGYRAYLNNRPLPVAVCDLAVPAVEIPPEQEGVLRLRYAPVGLTVGVAVAGVALTLLLALLWGERRP